MARMRRLLLAAATAATCAIAAAAAPYAATAEPRFELTPGVGVRGGLVLEADDPLDLRSEANPAGSWGLSLAWFVRSDGWLEVLFDRHRLRFRGDGSGAVEDDFDLEVDYLQLGGGYQPRRRGARPYVTVAVGVTRQHAYPGSTSQSVVPSGSIGGGVKLPMGRRALLRLEGRAWGTFTETEVSVACGAGCRVDLRGTGWGQLGLNAGLSFKL